MQSTAHPSVMETLADELCDSDHDWEENAKVKRSLMVSTGPYSEVLEKRKRKSQQSTVLAFFEKWKDLHPF
jgi:hypothetical protein